ncbi:hypothetical protein C5L31_000926 [Secundilactobacillus malefermentans]|uniref:Probable septum site-determining protein MinC n=1 Tax=Secundilactobacillus malefermentans TaxID=176292 RepID=A0A4R5NIF2_9LACO|nr:septum site-determining protein MinC [Secundilactobacillus malefermentans]TDG74359.1 hypothetical protein C5L31_000926 [Secundilactobacillus malefermentans]
MQAVLLKGNQDGYQLILNQSASFTEIIAELKRLFDKLAAEPSSLEAARLSFDVLTEDRILKSGEKKQIEDLAATYPKFSIHKISSNVMTVTDAYQLKERENVHLISRTIRNGQEVKLNGDILFLGTIHEGGKLITTGNIFSMGNIAGILHAGYPNSEEKLILGNIHNAQQVRVGEQFDVIDDEKIDDNDQVVAYVNDLHILAYGKLKELKQINPKLYNRIGGQ